MTILGVICGGAALAMWIEVFGVGGSPDGGGTRVAIAAAVLTIAAIGLFLIAGRTARGPREPDDNALDPQRGSRP